MAPMIFGRMSNNKGFVTIDDIVTMSQGRDPNVRDKVVQYMQDNGINNGQLTQDQFTAYFEQSISGRVSRNPANDDANAERDFRALDKNGDGQLDANEMPPDLK